MTTQVRERWAVQLAVRQEFLRLCIAWALPQGGELIWPRDAAAVIALGVPCVNCHAAVSDPDDVEHRIHVHMVMTAGMHWSDGIWATCESEEA